MHLSFGIHHAVAAHVLLALADLLLVHGQDVQGLVEFYALALADVLRVVPVYHRHLYII